MKQRFSHKFNINFKKIGSDPKYLIWVIIAVGGIVTGFLTYFHLPKRVEALEEKNAACEKSVDKLANTVDTYIKVQAEKEKAQEKVEEAREKREDLLVSMFQQLLKANGNN
jgi:F0F1-type ATP synthase membrane subunit b/b'